MFYRIIFFIILVHVSIMAQEKVQLESGVLEKSLSKNEVVENPTLKNLSGSLNRWSLYSSFTYRGASLKDPLDAERPNILEAEEAPSLTNMSGNLGVKYRLSARDNLSFQLGLYSTTPFHSTHTASNKRIQSEFDNNHQNIDVDDPVVSYFRTYTLGSLQNVTFLKYQHVTRGVYRDYGWRSTFSLSHAAAYKIGRFAYLAASLTYENAYYDQEQTLFRGRWTTLYPYQVQHRLRGNISMEAYLRSDVALRFITDIFSYYQMRKNSEVKTRGLKQTLAATYFFNRDISIAPNIQFVAEDLRAERTNLGLTLTVNI